MLNYLQLKTFITGNFHNSIFFVCFFIMGGASIKSKCSIMARSTRKQLVYSFLEAFLSTIFCDLIFRCLPSGILWFLEPTQWSTSRILEHGTTSPFRMSLYLPTSTQSTNPLRPYWCDPPHKLAPLYLEAHNPRSGKRQVYATVPIPLLHFRKYIGL